MLYSVFFGSHKVADGDVSETELLHELGALCALSRGGTTYIIVVIIKSTMK
jgi:hypothetical protein